MSTTAAIHDRWASAPRAPGASAARFSVDAVSPARAPRLHSLDAFRGFIMLVLASEGYLDGFGVDVLPGNRLAELVGGQFRHVAWEGFAFWDLIMPSFLLMVGVAIPYALASRRADRISRLGLALRVARRSLVLIALGLVCVSNRLAFTDFTFVHDALLQIGLAYPFACLIAGRLVRTQCAVLAAILVVYWFAFFTHPLPPAGFDAAAAGLVDRAHRFGGLFAHWNRYGNFAADFDAWFLNLFPRQTPFRLDPSGLATLNFIPSIATIGIGVMIGEFLRRPMPATDKLRRLIVVGAALAAGGALLGETVCPLVKAIWTPSWAVFSAGCALLMLSPFYWAVDVRGVAVWPRPLAAVGANSLAMYLMLHLSKDWIWNTVGKHLGPLSWTLQSALVFAILWLSCVWLYRRDVVITA